MAMLDLLFGRDVFLDREEASNRLALMLFNLGLAFQTSIPCSLASFGKGATFWKSRKIGWRAADCGQPFAFFQAAVRATHQQGIGIRMFG